MKQRTLGIIRHLLTFAGGFVVAKGLIPESMVPEIIGALMTLIGGVWSVVDKKGGE